MTIEQMRAAYRKGLLRHDTARRNGTKDRFHGDPRYERDSDGQGKVAEELVREALGLPPSDDSDLLEPDTEIGDINGEWEVRWTGYTNGRCIVRPTTPDHLKVVLVTGYAPYQEIRGWILAADAKSNDDWWEIDAWWVPQEFLHELL